MDPKLIEAIVLRIKVGHTKENIQAEMLAIGYDENFFQDAYDQAMAIAEGKQELELSALTPNTEEHKETVSVVEPLPSYQKLFEQSWALTIENIKLLVKGVITFIGTIIFAGIIGVLLLVYVPASEPSDYILKFVLLFTLFIFSLLALFACLNGLLRGLLKRRESQRYTQHFIWAYLNIVGISVVSIYVSIVTQVGYLFFYIPGLMLSVYLLFALYVAIDGQDKGVKVLTVSTSLVYGRFWPVLGRVIISVIILALATALFAALSALVVFLNPFWVPTYILVIISAILAAAFWQLCYTVTLFEALKNIPVAKPLPLPEEKLTNIYRITIGFAVVGILVLMTLIGFGVLEVDEETSAHTFMSDIEISRDATNKQILRNASQMAFQQQSEIGSFTDVCTELVLPADTKCESSELNFAIETPLTWGFYCIDSSGFNEVKRRSMIESDTCRQE